MEEAFKNYMCNPRCKKLDVTHTISQYFPVENSDSLTFSTVKHTNIY